MTGIVRRILQTKCYGFISGDDGKEYFFSLFDSPKIKRIKRGWVVEFESVVDEGKKLPKAVKIKKLSSGSSNRHYLELDRIKTALEKSMPDGDDKSYFLRDIETMKRIFARMPDDEKLGLGMNARGHISHWVLSKGTSLYECSSCAHPMNGVKTNFCSYCGARMAEDDEENEPGAD